MIGKLHMFPQPPPWQPACWRWRLDDVERFADDRETLRVWQDERCAGCGRPESDSRRFVEDHDHETGLVRGLLCRSCNTLEATHGPDDPGWWSSYRERPPTTILGLTIVYYSSWKPRPYIIVTR